MIRPRPRPLMTDLIGGIVVTLLGVAGFVESWRMPRFEHRNVDPFTVPGLTPGVLSAVLALLGIALVLRALAGRGGATPLSILSWPGGSAQRMGLTLALGALYGFVLFGHVPFLLATSIFVFAFTVGTELLNPQRTLGLVPLTLGALVLGVATACVIRFVFVQIFLVRLPG